ncbi:MAG: hypothetical protein JNM21_02065 [Taibaiella sp.]|nr:hypothetical protein [Taibaiella sp.]
MRNGSSLLIILLVAIPGWTTAQCYEAATGDPGYYQIVLDQGRYKKRGISCESEAVSKGTYRFDGDTLKLFPYSDRDSILPLPVFQFTPHTDCSVIIKVLDESGNPWRGFNVMTGNSKQQFYDLYTDSNGTCSYTDTSHRYIILNYLNNSLDFSDEANYRYLWDSKATGTYLVIIPDDGFFVLDRNVIIDNEPFVYLKKGNCLYRLDDPTQPLYKIRED